jgi:hypothetical protein
MKRKEKFIISCVLMYVKYGHAEGGKGTVWCRRAAGPVSDGRVAATI